MKKTAPKKNDKIRTKARVVKKTTVTKKRPVAQKKPHKNTRKNNKVLVNKQLGIFACLVGVLALVALISFTINRLFLLKTDSSTDSVLGATTKLLPPANLKGQAKDGRVVLSWVNTAGGEGQLYRIYTYNKTTKEYKSNDLLISANISRGKTMAVAFDQELGTVSSYRVLAVSDATANAESSSFSNAVVVSMPNLAVPGGLKTSNADSGIRVSWNHVSGATGYKIYRSEGLGGAFGKYEEVGMIGLTQTGMGGDIYGMYSDSNVGHKILSPTDGKVSNLQKPRNYYIDSLTTPGARYNYKVQAVRVLVADVNSISERVVESRQTVLRSAIAPKITAPTKFSALVLDRTSIALSLPIDNIKGTHPFMPGQNQDLSDYMIHCDKCGTSPMSFNYFFDDFPNRWVSEDGKTMVVYLTNLKPNTEYKLSASIWKRVNGKTYEGPKSKAISVRTLQTDDFIAPKGLKYNGLIVGGGISFLFDIPDKKPDNYSARITCWNNSGSLTADWSSPKLNVFEITSSTYGKKMAFDVDDFGYNKGKCSVILSAEKMFNNVNIKFESYTNFNS